MHITTPLHIAIEHGHYNACGLLIDCGAYIDDMLLYAARHGRTDICKLLLEYEGIDINEESDEGTALHYAAGGGYLDTCEFFIEQGLDVDHIDNYEHIPLHYAAGGSSQGHADVIKLLIEHGSDVDACYEDYEYNTPLLASIKYGGYLTCEAILKGGADPNKSDGGGRTPLAYAIHVNKDADLCKLLISYGAIADDCGSCGCYDNEDLKRYIRSIGEDDSCIYDYW